MTHVEARGLYEYHPLSLTHPQIRLVSLNHALSVDGFVDCNLHVFDLDSAPHYISLSYLWGPPELTQTILVDGKRHQVRQNLFDFLRCFRNDRSNVQYLWIDQLCIAQSLEDERNQQVCLMSRIYRHCLYVIVWLGDQTAAWPAEFALTPTYSCALAAFSNPYFDRLWVIQEILLAPQVRVLCGECKYLALERAWLSLDELLDFVRRGEDNGGIQLDSVFLRTIFGDPFLQRDPKERGPMRLSDCIKRFSKYKCSEPRDKVYGLLGLVHEDQRPVIDYKKTLEEIVADVLVILTRVYWHEVRDTSTLVNTAIPVRYWLDWDKVTSLTRHMNLDEHEEHNSALSYLVQQVYGILDAAKPASQCECPITTIGHGILEGKGRWWYEHEGRRRHLLFFPEFTAWSAAVEGFRWDRTNQTSISASLKSVTKPRELPVDAVLPKIWGTQ